ncbi:hypothetical protein E4T66_01725 [Sinimarinibacterium sp. CAU 1509]|uniref:MoaF N-terminal domain-containing protein n=1 Tax=Sinimarinibacterium sp. CAU 1509 TaxID=2562283 RepID=UPI0010ACC533|nr:MoaF N-terminal domain-containing protein [Sinimarinibacterium sp. CAU 1509]TJY64969.1 hypothetical protein E4T66_01725 [Sinimarinibacterium sp. CAU 1509]
MNASNASTPTNFGRRQHRWIRRLGGGLVLLLVSLLSFVRMADGSTVGVSEVPVRQLVGTTLRYAMPDGEYVEREFVAQDKARWRMLNGTREGDQGTEALKIVRMGPAVFFVNRVDAQNGDTISEVYNLATQTVAVYVTRLDPDDANRRIEESVEGRVEIIRDAGEGEHAAAGGVTEPAV